MYIETTTSLGCLYQTFHVLVNRAEEVRSAPNTCILPKETQSQPRSTGLGDDRPAEAKLGEAKEATKEQVLDVVNAANTYYTHRRSIYASLGMRAPRRRDPLCPFRSFCGVVVVVASPLCVAREDR